MVDLRAGPEKSDGGIQIEYRIGGNQRRQDGLGANPDRSIRSSKSINKQLIYKRLLNNA